MNDKEKSSESQTEPDSTPALIGEKTGTDSRRRHLTATFLKEVAIFVTGVFIGFFWSQYFIQVGEEAHIIIVLLLVIFCLIRYIYLSRR